MDFNYTNNISIKLTFNIWEQFRGVVSSINSYNRYLIVYKVLGYSRSIWDSMVNRDVKFGTQF